jgi:hypothetical protein
MIKVNKSEIKNRVREKSPIKLRGRLTNSASGRHGWTGPYAFHLCYKILQPRPAKNPRLPKFFQLAHTGNKTTVLFPS